jgi:hypothetical protein
MSQLFEAVDWASSSARRCDQLSGFQRKAILIRLCTMGNKGSLRRAWRVGWSRLPKTPQGFLILQCYEISSFVESARCAESGELTEMERHMLQTAKTLAEIIMFRSDLGFVTL